MRRPALIHLATVLLLLLYLPATGEAGGLGITSPASVGQQLKRDRSRSPGAFPSRVLEEYDRWKSGFVERTGLDFGVDYNALYFGASRSPGREESAGGVLRLYGKWDLLGRGTPDTGSLVFKIEHRHAYTALAPNELGFELGYVGLLHSTYSDQGVRTTNLYWKQRFNAGRALAFVGFLDVTDYVDVYLLASPWTSFNNLVFATGSGTIGGLPDGTLGVMIGGWLDDHFYLAAGITDANADPTDIGKGFDTFFNRFETFKSLELGWSSAQKRLLLDNLHLTLWQIDAREKAGTPSGRGLAFSASMTHDKRWMSFLRGGYSDGGGALLQASLSVGLSWLRNAGGDVFGAALNWGRPNQDDYPDTRDQWTGEVYYLWQLGKHLQLTPSLQWLHHPAQLTKCEDVVVAGIRFRAAF